MSLYTPAGEVKHSRQDTVEFIAERAKDHRRDRMKFEEAAREVYDRVVWVKRGVQGKSWNWVRLVDDALKHARNVYG